MWPMASILTDSALEAAIQRGDIRIDPWNPNQVNPTSYDLTLGDGVAVYRKCVNTDNFLSKNRVEDGLDFVPRDLVLNVKEEEPLSRFQIHPENGWVLKPGIGYLMHTRERIWTESYVPIVDGKSSIGRLFIQVHATAGFGDPGFDGQYTLEVIVQHRVRVFPGMRIGQIRFHTMEGELRHPYAGNYVGEAAMGAVGSRSWKQFSK
jgi:dCTP deaminase